MIHVTLQTREGELVSDHCQIPPFDPPPEVLVWGSRTFLLHISSKVEATYRECFTYWLPPEQKL